MQQPVRGVRHVLLATPSILAAYVANGQTTYAYDPVGNRKRRTRGGTLTDYQYDRADRIISAGGQGYTVNANGNVSLRGQTDAFEYDQINRLTAVKHPTTGTVRASHAYDGLGNRASTTAGGATTTYSYDNVGGLPVQLGDGAQHSCGPCRE